MLDRHYLRVLNRSQVPAVYKQTPISNIVVLPEHGMSNEFYLNTTIPVRTAKPLELDYPLYKWSPPDFTDHQISQHISYVRTPRTVHVSLAASCTQNPL